MLVGQQLGPYVVEKELGSGAMGAVYLGRHKESGRLVAVKIIAPGLTSNDLALARFKRESAILKQLKHPNIVRLLASGRFHGTPFYVMEYVEGESLDQVMERRGRISWEELIPIGRQLCAALQHAHEKGIIHRDLKPSNLMVLADGTVKLTDFGIAKDLDVTALTAANSTVGTASYMSPEQCKGKRDLTAKSDLYSMGVMFYELATGRKPFQAETIMDMFMQHTKGKFPRPSRIVLDIPVWLDNLICQLLEKKPERRPLSAEMVSETLGVIKDKWQSQQSAGLDALKKRKIDRSVHDVPIDEQDKEVARSLLGKSKKKKKAEPFYQQNWFTLSALAAILLGIGIFCYMVFFRAPSADELYAQARDLATSKDADKRLLARGDEGPINQFLTYYPEHAKAAQIRGWADAIDAEICEAQMYNRRKNFAPEGVWEKQARLALEEEEAGKLDEAREIWKELTSFRDNDDPSLRPWGLLAQKRLAELKSVEDTYADLKRRVLAEITLKRKEEGKNKCDELAVQAARAERDKNLPAARLLWEDLQRQARLDEERIFDLLATKRLREMTLKGAETSPQTDM